MDLKGRNFLTLKDFTPEEITYLIDLSAEVKGKKKQGVPVDNYKGKNVALIFEKTAPGPAAHSRWLPMIWNGNYIPRTDGIPDGKEREY